MVINIRLVVGDEARRALRARMGRPGLATRYEITSLVDMMLEHEIADAVGEWKASKERRRTRRTRTARGADT
jgi:hypothetical protein